ncbi:5403_t:CDS:2 [Funneliformis caledonium]|uniref:5403_t:CDS:1 n=1 Tax=Funneliformis caledonium TaxID=1117310 RepID=A0A9N9BM10_9GLOM|nr:5403_t:CDS:2 [Funneliformis caledonium]
MLEKAEAALEKFEEGFYDELLLKKLKRNKKSLNEKDRLEKARLEKKEENLEAEKQKSISALASAIMHNPCYEDIENDLSFLETLDAEEATTIDNIFNNFQDHDPPNPDWIDESGGQENSRFADHYLTYQQFAQYCRRAQPDFTTSWAFKDKSGWENSCIKKVIAQCYHYSTNFFNGDENNLTRKYISIITDSRQYRLWTL